MFSKYLADVSDQKFLVQVFGPGEVVPAFQVFDAASAGTEKWATPSPPTTSAKISPLFSAPPSRSVPTRGR